MTSEEAEAAEQSTLSCQTFLPDIVVQQAQDFLVATLASVETQFTAMQRQHTTQITAMQLQHTAEITDLKRELNLIKHEFALRDLVSAAFAAAIKSLNDAGATSSPLGTWDAVASQFAHDPMLRTSFYATLNRLFGLSAAEVDELRAYKQAKNKQLHPRLSADVVRAALASSAAVPGTALQKVANSLSKL
eukprot:TRINITY_DN286_c1_g1_i3.p1 TRINITY_DN286_c1_g1~~TRINITY_DN286_c1_g1_i3.p1  ORF type:complete len:190 (-),score=50.40 TRINITY_DN286_c1_g1_i3:39-608(-)